MVMRARWRGFELPTSILVDQETLTSCYGRFVAEPFERGFGITIGNSLRRVLLSSLEGAAPTRIKIEGVLHEFSSLPGIVEDVTDVVLNVKQLLVKVKSEEPQTLKLDVTKTGVVTAGDISAHPLVEVVNPDLRICEISAETRLAMEIEVSKGRGYVTAEENDSEDREIGIIPIDSIYSPVRRVRYRTENTRVGQLTDYDKLILEVWTDGTVHPEAALVEAGKILRKHLVPFVNYSQLGTELEGESFEDETGEEQGEEGAGGEHALPVDLEKPIGDMGFSVRAVNALEGAEIATLGELVSRSEQELLKLRNFGKTTLKEIEAKLSKLGLELGTTPASV